MSAGAMKNNKGFTLAELAIALVIIAILLVGAMIPLRTQIDTRNTADTQRSMDSIKEALIGFALANGRLPCPADGTIAAGSANAGVEQCGGNSYGVVPWATLGVSEADAWGRRFTYYVSPHFADAVGTTFDCTPTPTPTQSSFALCSLGVLTVNTRNDSTHVATAIGAALPAVIISHGRNGYGAYTPAGTTLAAPAAGTDEAANAAHTNGATTFYSRTQTPSAAGCSDSAPGSYCEFDDIVAMISAPTLIARMVSAGKLP